MGKPYFSEGVQDKIGLLFMVNFVPCDIIFIEAETLRPIVMADEDDMSALWLRYMSFNHLWLALLFVVVEGLEELKLLDRTLEEVVSVHRPELKSFRNGLFHPQKDDRKITQFHGVEQLNWAKDLHSAIYTLFVNMRSEAATVLSPRA